jgi:hypothetical protein
MADSTRDLKGIAILLGLGLILFYIYNKYYSKKEYLENDGTVSFDADMGSDLPKDVVERKAEISPEEYELRRKFKSKNSAQGEYKRSNYANGRGGNDMAELDSFFAENNDLINSSYVSNNDFAPADLGEPQAGYRSGKKTEMTVDEIFNVDEYLPQEKTDDWFEVMPEPISVKNRNLINVTRAIGVNTIGSSLKNPSYDIRGNIPNPKMVVSPWNQSSIEPDLNIKGLCN